MNNLKSDTKWSPNFNGRLVAAPEFCDEIYALEGACINARVSGAGATSFRVSAKQASVSLRKFFAEGLLTSAVKKPQLHPLRPVDDDNGSSISMQSTLRLLAYSDGPVIWTTEISDDGFGFSSLPGWKNFNFSMYEMSSDMFILDTAPLRLEQWLKQPMIKVGALNQERTFTLLDVLKYAANSEGAHFDDGNPKRSRSGSKAVLGGYLDALSTPEGITYPRFVVLAVACHLRNRGVESFRRYPDVWEKYIGRRLPSFRPGYLSWSGQANMGFTQPWSDIGVNLYDLNKPPPPVQHHGGWFVKPAVRR